MIYFFFEGTYRINFDVEGVDWRSRGAPIVQITVLNRHHFRPNPRCKLQYLWMG